MADEPKQNKNESASYEAMLANVQSIVQKLESNTLGLDQMVDEVDHGLKLIKQMKERLDQTKHKIDVLRVEYENNGE